MSGDSSCERCGLAVHFGDYVDFLTDTAVLGSLPAETDYVWDYRSDPSITPLTLARWAVSADVHRDVVARHAGVPAHRMVSVGGGGENWTGRRLNDRVEEYVVVDPSSAQLERQVYPQGAECRAVRAVAEMLPVVDGWADVVEFQGVIDHVADAEQALREARRVLAPGGHLTVQVTNEHSWYKRAALRLGVHREHSHAHRYQFSVQSLSQLLESTGFRVFDVTTVAFLRLPLPIERMLARLCGRRGLQRFVRATDRLLSPIVGRHGGGIMTVVARPD